MSHEIVSEIMVNPYAFPPILVGILTALLGSAVLIREKASLVSLSFWGLTLVGAFWLVANGAIYIFFDPQPALFWAKIEQMGIVFIPSMVYFFALSVTNQIFVYRRSLYLSFLLSCFFLITVFFTDSFVSGVRRYFWGYFAQYGPLTVPYLGFFIWSMMMSLRLFYREYARSSSKEQKHRLRTFLIAFCIAYAGSIDFLPKYGVSIYPCGYAAVFIFLVIIAQGIWRYQLVDITPALAAEQILKILCDGVLVFDREGIVRVANQAVCGMFQYSEKELIGKPVWMIHHDFFPKEKFDNFIHARVIHGYQTVLTNHVGQKMALDVSTSTVWDENKEPAAIVCVVRDMPVSSF